MKSKIFFALLLIGATSPLHAEWFFKSRAAVSSKRVLESQDVLSRPTPAETTSLVLNVAACSSMEISSRDEDTQYREERVCRVALPDGVVVSKIRLYARDYSGLSTYSDVIQPTTDVKVKVEEHSLRDGRPVQANWNCSSEARSSFFQISENVGTFSCVDAVKQAGSDLTVHLSANVLIGTSSGSASYLRQYKHFFLPVVQLLEVVYSPAR